MKNFLTKKRLYFIVLFIGLVYITKNINFSALVGADSQFFTLFQFFGPIAGGFLGSIAGGITILTAQLIDMVVVGKEFSLINFIRLTPMIFAAMYFALMTKRKIKLNRIIMIAIPAICMTLFMLHPVGRTVWYFSLYWTIPIIATLIPESWKGQLFFRSYGATFTAHAIGGAAWIYTVPMPAEAWIGLIPVVAVERFLFGVGIAGSYVVFNTVLDYVVDMFNIPNSVIVEKRYALKTLLKRV